MKEGVEGVVRKFIGIMLVLWLCFMAFIIWNGTDGKWTVEDAEKIGELKIAQYSNQIIVVAISEDETTLCFYQREQAGDWNLVLETQAQIGKNGLGKRKEGDGKTPIGSYRFTYAFGILENPGAKIEYVQVDETDYWIDDAESEYYNQFIDSENVIKDWNSAEHICEYGEVYHYVLAINYNESRIPGAGSAVFLHCTTAKMEGTAGCIAIPEVFMKQLLKKVEPQCVLIIDEAKNILKY